VLNDLVSYAVDEDDLGGMAAVNAEACVVTKLELELLEVGFKTPCYLLYIVC
jgi:hypothetical protein